VYRKPKSTQRENERQNAIMERTVKISTIIHGPSKTTFISDIYLFGVVIFQLENYSNTHKTDKSTFHEKSVLTNPFSSLKASNTLKAGRFLLSPAGFTHPFLTKFFDTGNILSFPF
jgi:hypothetical protein